MTALADTRVLVLGTGGIAAEIARQAAADGAHVVVAGRRLDAATAVAAESGAKAGPGAVTAAHIDLADEASIATLADELGTVDHVVSTAASPTKAPLSELDHAALVRAFDTKVFGPALLAGRLDIRESLTLFSGVVAWRPSPASVTMAVSNGATAFLATALAVELAPVRVNAISPGIVDSGQWNRLGDVKARFLDGVAQRNPVGRIGSAADLAAATLALATNRFITGTVLHVDGGHRLA